MSYSLKSGTATKNRPHPARPKQPCRTGPGKSPCPGGKIVVGTGSMRYNYGSSDLEAILSGHDPYTYGQCGSCGGTGRAK